ncbi:flagellar biosynthesis protein FlhF [Pseudoxanthomonas mexicana]|uniref:flagellar biosynthesis protein FlhF n=1 Tax=Pseudoxanthomonas mexicana TaxID=128785 RepID=UPI00398B09C8
MKIKRFVAPDMRTAFAMVRQEHGPDAVILSNRMTEDGIEIVAASNYDEALVQRTLESMRPAGPQFSDRPASDALSAMLQSAPPSSAARAAHPSAAGSHAPSPAEAAAAYFGKAATSRQNPAVAAAPATVPPPAPRKAAAAPAVPAAATPAPVAALPPANDAFGSDSFAAKLAACLPQTPAPVAATPEEPDFDGLPMLPPIAPPAALPEEPAPAPVLSVVETAAEARENDEQLLQMRAELSAMREMIEREMSRLTDERLRGSPVRAQALDLMDDYGFDAGLQRDIALQIPADTELHRGRGLMLGLLSKKLPIAPTDPLEEGGVIALVGPTGAGKTTTIAKLAAAYAERHNARDIALVTTDTVRVGGREQLHSYGRQLGIAVHEADSDAGLARTLDRLRDYKLILIDTAGLGQRDRSLVGQLNWLRSAGQVRTLLVLPANSHFGDLDEVVRRFSGARPSGVVLTKVDETGRLGSALSVIVDHQLPMVWIADGQHVPQDLHRANGANLVLRLDQLRREADEPCAPETIHVA